MTDVEGSSPLWEAEPDDMTVAMRQHDTLIARVVRQGGGRLLEDRGEGDSSLAVFDSAGAAVAAAIELQRAFASAYWPTSRPLRIRLAAHSAPPSGANPAEDEIALARCSRLRSSASGGQTVVSGSVHDELIGVDTSPISLRSLGMHQLRGLSGVERVFQAEHPDLPRLFPPLKTQRAPRGRATKKLLPVVLAVLVALAALLLVRATDQPRPTQQPTQVYGTAGGDRSGSPPSRSSDPVAGDLELVVVDRHGRPSPGIEVEVVGQDRRTLVTDAAGAIRFTGAPGSYRLAIRRGCQPVAEILDGWSQTVDLGSGRAQPARAQIAWRQRLAPSAPGFASAGRRWPVGQVVQVSYTLVDRCASEGPARSVSVPEAYDVVTSTQLDLVSTTGASDADGIVRIDLRCDGAGPVQLWIVDRLKGDRFDLARSFSWTVDPPGTRPTCDP